MGAILGALGELGYWWAYRVLDAQYDNLAQRRERVFIVGHTRSRRAAEVLLEPEGLCWNPPPSRETGQAVTALTANGVGTCGADDNQAQGGHLIARALLSHGQHIDYETETFVVANSLTASAGHHGRSSPRGDGADNLVVAGFSGGQGSKARGIGYTVEQSPTLRAAESGSNRAPCVLAFQPQAGGATALSVGKNAPSLTGSQIAACTDGYSVRRLLPIECERLQGFPDGWTEGHADSHRYRMLGNAVAVPVVEWILRRIAGQWGAQ
jgi:DNA (cytosine-5)-methyltransferase 1